MTEPEQEPLEGERSAPIVPVESEPISAPPLSEPPMLPPQPKREVFPPWSGWDVAVVLGFTLAAVFLFSTVALGVAHLLTREQHLSWNDLASSPVVIIGSQVAAYPVVIVFMIAMVGNKSREPFQRAIRWNWPGAAGMGFLFGGIGFAFAVEFASRWLPIPKSLPVDKYFSDTAGAYLMAAFGVTLAPLLEELFFRGMLYPVLRRAYGILAAVLLTAVAFAAIHGAQLGNAWAPLLSIFVVGIVFTLVRERADSVAASFLTHCGYNLALFSMLWIGTDHFRHMEKALG
ncbi:MAG: type II CAAX endopeptidase family protein [Candidatus Korobacteraceae bacterium]